MNESLEELKAIIDNSPEGATHYDGKTYFRFEMYEHGQAYLVNKNGTWCRGLPAYPVYSCRSLSDIKRIVELMELNQNMHTTVAGYIYGKDWEHWNEFNRGKFKL